jgi:TIR domain
VYKRDTHTICIIHKKKVVKTAMNQENTPAPVFLSYAHKNLAVAVRLEHDLWELNIPVWRDERNIQPGDDWEQKIRDAIAGSYAVLYLATPDARTSRIVRAELALAAMCQKPVYLLWREGKDWVDVVPLNHYPDQHIDIREYCYQIGLQQLFTHLKHISAAANQLQATDDGPGKDAIMSYSQRSPGSSRQRLPTTAPLRERPTLFGRIFNRKHNADSTPEQNTLGSLQKRQDPGRRNPYKGLQAFTPRDANDFFGREDLVNTMMWELKQILRRERIESQEPRFLTVVGPSGSGKSSVVMAGLLPCLQKGAHGPTGTKSAPSEYIPGSDHWTYLSMQPGTNPVGMLAEMLIPLLPLNERNKEAVLTNLQDETTRALHMYAATFIVPEPGKRLVLVVDQFEELFTEATEASRQQFIDLLANAATEPDNKVIVVITLRADFSDQVMKSSLPYRMIEAHRIPIPPMTVENLRAVIEKPARLPGVGVRFETNLIGELLLDIRGREENLPLLQFTLDKLFQERRQQDNILTLAAYHALGRVHGALSKHAKETYENLPSNEHRQLAEKLFIRLINPGGVEQDATRRRVPKATFTYDDQQQNRQMQETIRAFVDARLLTANEVTTENLIEHTVERIPTYEISHEALISEWHLLRDWISKAREDILTQQNMGVMIDQWQKQKRSARRLYRGDQLVEARAWSKRNAPNRIERQFIKASVRTQRNMRILWAIVAVIIVSIVFGVSVLPTVNLIAPYFIPTIVTNLQDSGPGSLHQVIQNAPKGSTITFAASLHGTILLKNDNLDIKKDLTLSGPDDPRTLSISNGMNKRNSNGDVLNKDYNVHVFPGVTVTFKNISFTDSIVRLSSIIENEGNLTIDNCIIEHNISYYKGGGIDNHGSSSQAQAQLAIINNSDIYNNTSSYNNGGGIANDYGSLTITNSIVRKNNAQGNGGGIYSGQGQLTLTNSTVDGNQVNDNGGGIYSLNNSLTLTQSTITNNKTTSPNKASSGGGITAVGNVLELNNSTVTGNTTYGYGGGLVLLGCNGFIDQSTITDNQASIKGGGLAVEKDTESNSSSLTLITHTEVNVAANASPKGNYFIAKNIAPTHPDILGDLLNPGEDPIIAQEDTSEITGGPAPFPYPAEASSQYRGVVNLDGYCYAHAKRSLQVISSEDMHCVLYAGKQIIDSIPLNTDQACQWSTQDSDVIARLADFNDPASWQCYAHEQRLGGIVNHLNDYCKSRYNTDLAPIIRTTAYDWYCLDQQNNPIGIAITDACQWYYPSHSTDAFDRLVNYFQPDGWECWAPKAN